MFTAVFTVVNHWTQPLSYNRGFFLFVILNYGTSISSEVVLLFIDYEGFFYYVGTYLSRSSGYKIINVI